MLFRSGSHQHGKTDWAQVDTLTDLEIENAAKADPDAAPILDQEWFRTAKLVQPEPKVTIARRTARITPR